MDKKDHFLVILFLNEIKYSFLKRFSSIDIIDIDLEKGGEIFSCGAKFLINKAQNINIYFRFCYCSCFGIDNNHVY